MTASETSIKRQVPGFYRKQAGDFLVTALYDGFINLAPSLFHGAEAAKMQELIDGNFQPQTNDGVPTAVTTYLIDDGVNRTLVNTGGAKCAGPTMGGLLENLRAAGYAPESITAVLLTHLHFDHVCGLTNADGQPLYPQATVYASTEECAFWLSPETAAAAPESARPFFEMAAKAVAPYVNCNAFVRFKDGDEIRPGIKAMLTPGHTPGHASFLLNSRGESLLLWGDIVHSHALQFAHPEISNDFDSDQAQAIATRQTLFDRSVREKWLIGGDHLPFPGLGHLTKNAAGYRWVPLEYELLPQEGA
ncbi:MBL fold metallo-hydrolase [Deltaproteobacteria bacterium OttesenSCG-928-K17]|nr:MBL fold metallo-hydrolase [Deltaproteobacteria bacterium OttesenSCG-928-K17]